MCQHQWMMAWLKPAEHFLISSASQQQPLILGVLAEVHEILGSGLAFPKISKQDWASVSRRSQARDDDHAFSFEIVTYQRIHRMDLAA